MVLSSTLDTDFILNTIKYIWIITINAKIILTISMSINIIGMITIKIMTKINLSLYELVIHLVRIIGSKYFL